MSGSSPTDSGADAILANVARHISLDAGEKDHFISLLVAQEFRKKASVQEPGKPCKVISFVCDGALRAFYRDTGGDDHIIMFAVRDWWITDMHSFVNGRPAMLAIEAVEDSRLLQLSKSDMDALVVRIPKFERFFRIIFQNAYVREQLRAVENLSLPARERYENFIRNYPQFAHRLPLKQIASYLGITPEFLSTIRKAKS